uniref:Uncharacterized protein n=1 Tax=Glossina pallidipes TaxID=7398 RepID=A0A1B0A9M0_GLOPL
MKDTGSGAKNSTSSIEPGNRNISLRCITYSCRVWVCVVFGVSSTTTKFTGRLTRGEISEVVITTPSSNTRPIFVAVMTFVSSKMYCKRKTLNKLNKKRLNSHVANSKASVEHDSRMTPKLSRAQSSGSSAMVAKLFYEIIVTFRANSRINITTAGKGHVRLWTQKYAVIKEKTLGANACTYESLYVYKLALTNCFLDKNNRSLVSHMTLHQDGEDYETKSQIVIALGGRYAGRKAIIPKTMVDGAGERLIGHTLSMIKAFLKLLNYNHLMSTRYAAIEVRIVFKPVSNSRRHTNKTKTSDFSKNYVFKERNIFQLKFEMKTKATIFRMFPLRRSS